jgi:hypothetical protein
MMSSRAERWAKKHKELDQQLKFGSVEYLKLKEGANIIRLFPPMGGREDFWVELMKSYNVGPNGKSIVRPDQFGKPDPVADDIARLNALGDEASKTRASAMKGKTRILMFAIDRSDEAKGPQLWDGNNMILRDVLAIVADSDYDDITDPEKGFDITVHYTPGTKKSFPKWQIVPKRNPSPLGFDTSEDLFETKHVLEPSEHDYIVACLAGTEEAFIAEKKAERAATQAAAPATPAEAPPTSPAPAAVGGEDAAIQAELDRVRAAKAAKAAAPAPPTAPAAPAAPAAPGTPAALLSATYWAVIGGETQEASGVEVQALLDQGHADATVMTQEAGAAWSNPVALGFIATPATPTPPSQVGADLEAALK